MAYAQKNYPQIQGINGKYSISAIGCFVTAFCNLEADYGVGIDPLTLNDYFVNHGTYIDIDDGIRDDLGWGSVSSFDGITQVSHTVDHGTAQTAGWPSTNQSIVRFHYRSISHPTLPDGSPNMIFHFCKVADAAAHTIVDSWDGVTKESPYGEPTAYAEYSHEVPVPVAPPPPEAPAPVENPLDHYVFSQLETPLNLITRNDGTNLWDLNFASYPDAHARVTYPAGTPFVAYAKAERQDLDHPVYFLDEATFNGSRDAGINTVDLTTPPAPADPVEPTPPAPEAPAPAPETDGETVPVTVVPPDPDKWQHSYKSFLSPVWYTAKDSIVIEDVAKLAPDTQLLKDQPVLVAGTFDRDGYKYYRSKKSADTDRWYGLPVEALRKQSPVDDAIDAAVDLALNKASEIRVAVKSYTKHEKHLESAGGLLGTITRWLQKLHLKKNKE